MDRWTINIFIDNDTIEMKDERNAKKLTNTPTLQPDARIMLDVVNYEAVRALVHRIQSKLPGTGVVAQTQGPAHVALYIGKLSGQAMSDLDALINDYINVPWEGTICALVEEYVAPPARSPRVSITPLYYFYCILRRHLRAELYDTRTHMNQLPKRDIPPGITEYVETFSTNLPEWVWHSTWKAAHGDNKAGTTNSGPKRRKGAKLPLRMKTRIPTGEKKYEVGIFRGREEMLMHFWVPKEFRVGVPPTNEEVLREVRWQVHLDE